MQSTKVLVHDFVGHTFQALLPESLAKRGHRVTRACFAGDKGPRGIMSSRVFGGGGGEARYVKRLVKSAAVRN